MVNRLANKAAPRAKDHLKVCSSSCFDDEQIAAFDEQAKTLVPLGHVAAPESIASAALFLASRDAEYVNGVELAVDGGFSQI